MKLLLTLLVAVACGLSLTSGARQDGPEWLDDLDEAFESAARTGRPLLIVFR